MWFGTEDGLNKWDGYDCWIYRHDQNDTGSISNNNISQILEDIRGDLWIGTIGGGLNLYDREKDRFIKYLIEDKDGSNLGFNHIQCIIEDHSGNFWIGYDTGGLINLEVRDRNINHFKYSEYLQPNCLSNDDVWALCEDNFNNIWIGTYGEGVDVLDPITGAFRHYIHDPSNPLSISHNDIRCIFMDSRHNIWIGTEGGGLNLYDPEKDGFVHFQNEPGNPASIGSDSIFSLCEDASGGLWIGTESAGLNVFHPDSRTFSRFTNNVLNRESLSHNSVESLYFDGNDTIWIGTYNGGVNYFHLQGEKFTTYRQTLQSDSLSSNIVLCFLEDSEGQIWVGTDGGGLNQFDLDNNRFIHFRNNPRSTRSLSHDSVLTLHEDREGNLWIGTYTGGLNLFHQESRLFEHFKTDENDAQSISDNDVRSIFEDSRGNLWVGTMSGLNIFDRKARAFRRFFQNPDNPSGISADSIISIYEDSRGNLWIGTYGGGLNLYDYNTETFRHIVHNPDNADSLSNNFIFSLLEDSKGRFWIGTGSGLNLFHPETLTFTHFFIDDGLPNDYICGILEDDRGDLWISTHQGISRFNPEAMTFRNYDIDDGLQGDEFHYSTCLKTQNGVLFFGGTNGFNAFNPEDITDNPLIPPIVITNFLIANRPVPIGKKDSPLVRHISETKELVLSYRHRVITFEFSALNFILPNKNRYAYMLEGFEEDWNQVGGRRSATYTNLDPKEYTFRVIGANNDGVWNQTGVEMKIRIKPPFWGTLWFRLFIAISILGIIYAVYIMRTIPIRKKNKELEQINTKLSHEIDTRKSAEDRIRESLKEKEYLLKEIHHRVNNNLQIISSLLHLESDKNEDHSLSKIYLGSQARIRSMALVYEKLYYSEDFGAIDFGEYIKSLIKELSSSIGNDSDRIRIDVWADNITFSIDKAIPCGLIVNELVSNSLRHAFPESFKFHGKIEVSMRLLEKSKIEVIVRDNGIGLPDSFDYRRTDSLGFRFITTIVEKQLGGKIQLNREWGTEFLIQYRI